MNRVSAGLVEGFAAGDVVGDFGFRERSEADLGGRVIHYVAEPMAQTDASDNGVFAARKQTEHGAGVIRIRWFFENVVIEGDGGVRT